ncbi:hypothetical protein BU25DRAFT_209490 [Macroventuria anomochaeta]|uniref:Uncharacterized protein n=1 Tax=Macroventuria anomochaeta TaxID=301207 RepID=A0ACB6RMZ6_9PLEO|nr:uncharacterized protein BU25DRAFT_209490 [Macroventuria anomochaeta]KAF2622478.1 hypothetical protein BU25DRAFT_209490 [Macroventuria anomochaeta]
MADGGVPGDIVADSMKECLDAERSNLLEQICDPVELYEYVHRNSSTSRNGSDKSRQAALRLGLEGKLKLLLESGFSPLNLQVLAKHMSRLVKKQHLPQESKLQRPLGKATYFYGVADPLGVLKPGEVHIPCSSSFVDEVTNEKFDANDDPSVDGVLQKAFVFRSAPSLLGIVATFLEKQSYLEDRGFRRTSLLVCWSSGSHRTSIEYPRVPGYV